ncbi:MAG: trimeric intracellular cation channel family protein [Oscillospiraceae bacterium]|nr:trimeric intracellular cation channel family protein [Oscillospiraceae bacterium]
MIFSSPIFSAAELIGTVAFAVSGAMVAIQKRMDLFGVLFLGVITACGGGMLRDLMIGRIPPNALVHPLNLGVAALVGLIVFVLARMMKERYLNSTETVNHIFNIFDAVGLGVFTVTGAQAAIDAGYAGNGLLVLSMGVITAIGGGLIRDIIIVEVPFVLTKHIYAVASILGGLAFYGLYLLGLVPVYTVLAGTVLTFIVRVLATIFKWDLPRAIE